MTDILHVGLKISTSVHMSESYVRGTPSNIFATPICSPFEVLGANNGANSQHTEQAKDECLSVPRSFSELIHHFQMGHLATLKPCSSLHVTPNTILATGELCL